MALIHLDAGVLIGFLDADDAHHVASRRVLDAAAEHRDHIAMAASAMVECLVGPARRGDEAVATVRAFIDQLPIEVVPLDEDVAVAAAMLRARHRTLRLPDALVIATARVRGADRLVTTDRRWPTGTKLGLDIELDRL